MRALGVDVDLVEAVAKGVASVDDVHRLARQVERAANRLAWREAVQQRSSRLARVLAAVELAIGARFRGRTKDESGRWLLAAATPDGEAVIVARVGGGSTRTLSDLRAPVGIDIFRPELLDLDVLRRMTRTKENLT